MREMRRQLLFWGGPTFCMCGSGAGMIERAAVEATKMVMTCDGLQALIDDFAGRSYQVLGPTVRDGATVYDTIAHLRNRNTFRRNGVGSLTLQRPLPANTAARWRPRRQAKARHHIVARNDD